MVDNLEAYSTASSEISESLREQILGTGYRRRRNTKPTKISQSEDHLRDYEVIPSRERPGKDSSDNKDASYHTAASGSGGNSSFEIVPNTAAHRESSFEIVPKQPDTHSTMSDNHRYTTIETQTVAIQTISTGNDSDWESRCCWGDSVCTCHDCEHHKDRHVYSKSKRNGVPIPPPPPPEETSDPDHSNFENFTDTSSQTEEIRRRHRNRCTCSCRCWNDYDLMTDQFSDSDDSYNTDFLDLPYQNNEEYLKLLRELEKKLIARNRERVRRTMMEFEKKSRQNQNLDKPVCDYGDDKAAILRKLGSRNHKKSVCCKCGRNRRIDSDILQNEKKWEEINFVQSVIQSNDGNCQPGQKRLERSLHKSHWQLDPRSGEWVKVSAFQQTDFSGPPHGDHLKSEHQKMPPYGSLCKNECCCRQKRRH